MTQTALIESQAPRSSKSDMVRKLLATRHGASLNELVLATGWQSHSCRALLTGLRKKGDAVMRAQRKDGTSYYRIGKAQARAAPEPDSGNAASATIVDAIDTTTSAGAA